MIEQKEKHQHVKKAFGLVYENGRIGYEKRKDEDEHVRIPEGKMTGVRERS